MVFVRLGPLGVFFSVFRSKWYNLAALRNISRCSFFFNKKNLRTWPFFPKASKQKDVAGRLGGTEIHGDSDMELQTKVPTAGVTWRLVKGGVLGEGSPSTFLS